MGRIVYEYRYHFVVPVWQPAEPGKSKRAHNYVDTPLDHRNDHPNSRGFNVNVPAKSGNEPVFIPWTNVAYVEKINPREYPQ